MEEYMYVLSAVTENTMRVLQRMAGLFARHRVNIEQLNVCEIGKSGLSCFNIVIHCSEHKTALVVKQLERIFEMKEVKVSSKVSLNKTNQEQSYA